MSSASQYTIVDYYGSQTGQSCGYCKQKRSSQSHGMWAHCLTAVDYQELIDRGWRRSGMYIYKAEMKTTCCPLYTIKCDTSTFKPTKSQKKIIKKVNRFLVSGERPVSQQVHLSKADEAGDGGEQHAVPDVAAPAGVLDISKVNESLREHHKNAIDSSKSEQSTTTIVSNATAPSEPKQDDVPKNTLPSVADPSKPLRKKAKLMRLERRLEKQGQKVADSNQTATAAIAKKTRPENVEKTLDQLISEVPENSVHKLKVKLVNSTEYASNKTEVLNVYRKYQMKIHDDPESKLTQKSFENFLVRSPLNVVLRPLGAEVTSVLCAEEYELYRRYQTIVHNDPPDGVDEFNRFLVTTPLQNTIVDGGPAVGYGSFHQQYYLDERLIAVGVIDILPFCVSSVYFFYDPDYRFLSLGSYASLREIQLVQQLNANTASLSNYYMGFYIHTCPKMRYKGQLRSSYLLCPEVYTWHLLDDSIKNRLTAVKYQRLNGDTAAKDADLFRKSSDLQNMLLLVNEQTIMTFLQYYRKKNLSSSQQKPFIEFGHLVGRSLAHRMLYNV